MSNAFVTIKMCYVYNQWYDISCAILYIYIIMYFFLTNVIFKGLTDANIYKVWTDLLQT